jgi:electron transfer flavoprotein beta subunit
MVRIGVLVKRVPDTASVFKIADDGRSVDLRNLKYVMSPYDEHAVEEAVRLKEAHGAEVVIVSLGPAEAKETIRAALAMGADSGALVTGEMVFSLSSRGIAHALAAVLRTLSPDIVFAGKQAVDDDAAQVPERVAELLGLPHVSVITRFQLDGNTATVDREIEGGHYTYEVSLPALFTMQKGINIPRYPTLPNIMKAKKKEIKEINIRDLGLAPDQTVSGLTVRSLSLPRHARLGQILAGDEGQQVRDLVKALREKEKVL